MKARTANLIIILTIAVVGLLTAETSPERIRWKWHEQPLVELKWNDGSRVEFGLRNDGVVVWREIMPATTNSPSEQAEMVMTNLFWTVTNAPMTNWLLPEWTNITIKPIYIPPRDHPEWTNWEEGARWWSNYTNWK